MGHVFNVNITSEIVSIDDWKVEIQDIIKSKTIFMTNTTTLDKHFIHAYCATCHTSQGDLNEAQLTRYLEHKIKQYKLQDMKAEREIDDKKI